MNTPTECTQHMNHTCICMRIRPHNFTSSMEICKFKQTFKKCTNHVFPIQCSHEALWITQLILPDNHAALISITTLDLCDKQSFTLLCYFLYTHTTCQILQHLSLYITSGSAWKSRRKLQHKFQYVTVPDSKTMYTTMNKLSQTGLLLDTQRI